MGSSKGGGNVKAPNLSQDYEKGLKVALKYLPKQLQAEYADRAQWDPLLTEQALGFQHKYDPQLAAEQRAALVRRDPQWLAVHEGLGDKIKSALDRGYLDPRQEAAYQQYSQLAGRGEPTRDRAYQALGKQVTGDTLRGGTASPETLRQMTQAILSRQPGLSYGEAQDMAAAVYTGQRSEALKTQRQQATGQFLQTATPTAQREASLANFYGMAPPEQNAIGLAGTYIQPSNSLVGAENMISGVQAPRAFGYVNPNAGYQGAQYGLQNYQNQLAQQQTQGSGNPWTNALSGAATGAQIGSVGGGYGAAAGALIGGVYGAYSDERLKINISRTGQKTEDGIDIIEFDMFGRRYKGGVIAQEAQRIRPDVVGMNNGYLTVNYGKLGLQEPEEVR